MVKEDLEPKGLRNEHQRQGVIAFQHYPLSSHSAPQIPELLLYRKRHP